MPNASVGLKSWDNYLRVYTLYVKLDEKVLRVAVPFTTWLSVEVDTPVRVEGNPDDESSLSVHLDF
jgi:hypothetical protein